MRQNDLLKSDSGDHLRVLLYGDQQSYVVNCQRCKMPFPIATQNLIQMEKLPQDMYRLLALDEDISDRQRQQHILVAESKSLKFESPKIVMTRGGFHLLPRGGRSSGDKGDQRMFSLRGKFIHRLRGGLTRCPGPHNHQPPSPAERRRRVIHQARDRRQTGFNGIGNPLIILMQQRQHIEGGKTINMGGFRVASFHH